MISHVLPVGRGIVQDASFHVGLIRSPIEHQIHHRLLTFACCSLSEPPQRVGSEQLDRVALVIQARCVGRRFMAADGPDSSWLKSSPRPLNSGRTPWVD